MSRMAETRPYYITTAISYPTVRPISAMPMRQWRRMRSRASGAFDGYTVLFLTGTDAHGLKMKRTAASHGMTPISLRTTTRRTSKKMVAALDCSNDDFISYHASSAIIRLCRSLAPDRGERRHLSVDLCRLVFGPRRSLLR